MELNVVELINQVGFPIAIAVYFIWDRTTLMKRFIQSNEEQTRVLSVLCDKMGVEIDGKL